jgi:hypothetical protein
MVPMTMALPRRWLLCVFLGAPGLACEDRINTTAQCLGDGSITERYDRYTFSVADGPALDVAGNCQVILTECNVQAPIGVRASEGAVVTVRGGSMIASDMLVVVSGNARVTFEDVKTQGRVSIKDGASVIGLTPAP